MAAATYNIRSLVVPSGKNRQQMARRVEIHKRVDFSKRAVAANEDAAFVDLPAGFVYERLDAILRTAEGETATLNVGVEGTIQAFAAAMNINGTPNTRMALGSPGYAAGQYFHTDTEVRVNVPNAANTVNVAIVDFIFVGYMTEAALEYGPGGAQL